ncbi:conserved membrane hypothetical protein [Frankia sp. AgKG'84/4]
MPPPSLPESGTAPAGGTPTGPARDAWATRVAAELRAWRARAAATADPAWSREGSAGAPGPAADGGSAATNLESTGRDGAGQEARGGRGSGSTAVLVPGSPWQSAAIGATGCAAPAVDSRAWTWRRLGGWLAGPAAVCAGIGVIVASGMRWATVRAYGFVEFTVRGTDPDQHGRLTVVLGILAVVAGLLLAGGRREWGRALALMTGLMVLLTAVIDLVHLYRDGPFADSALETDVSVGPGLWLVVGCGAMVFAAGFAARLVPRSDPGGPAGAHPAGGRPDDAGGPAATADPDRPVGHPPASPFG